MASNRAVPTPTGDRPPFAGHPPSMPPVTDPGETLGSSARWSSMRGLVPSLGLLLLVWGGVVIYQVRNRELPAPIPKTLESTISLGLPKGDYAAAVANPILPQPPSPFRFAEIHEEAGIDFVHVSGMTAEKHFPTANGSGVALFDYDGDGKLDLYFATCTPLPLGSTTCSPNRLYRNLGENRFQDVTETAGVGFRGFCHGAVAGDVDNDGDQDLFLCNYGPNVLYLNNGDGTFKDVSKAAGIDKPNWSSGGAFLDYDGDGDLDLYVANYGVWEFPRDAQYCTDERYQYAPGEKRVRFYCSPKTIRPVRHLLYRNNGDRTFTDVAEVAGVGRRDGRGFGVVTADLNGDGKTDIYVANDMSPNFVFLNRGDGTFEDATESSGAGFDGHGQMLSGMGVDAEDVDGDGRPELFVTNFERQPNTLYANLGAGSFRDEAPSSGMYSDSMLWVSWGCALVDFDNDGWPDCFVTNGHVDDNRHLLGQSVDYAQPALLHRNDGRGHFRLATRSAGPYFDAKHVGRGLAFGDLDDDGDVDLVVNHKDGAPALLRNDTKTSNHWIRLVLVGTRSNRDAVGTRVEVEAGGRAISRQRKGGGEHGVLERPPPPDRPGAFRGRLKAHRPLAVGRGHHSGGPRVRQDLHTRRAACGVTSGDARAFRPRPHPALDDPDPVVGE